MTLRSAPSPPITPRARAVVFPCDAAVLRGGAPALPSEAAAFLGEAIAVRSAVVSFRTGAIPLPIGATSLPTAAVSLPTKTVSFPTRTISFMNKTNPARTYRTSVWPATPSERPSGRFRAFSDACSRGAGVWLGRNLVRFSNFQ